MPVHHELSQQTFAPDGPHKSDATTVENVGRILAIVTHDLKTPLTGVKLYADILLSQAAEADAETRAKFLAIISSEADRMSRMITNIVDYQNIINGTTEWYDKAADVAKVISRCVKPYQIWCAAKGINFSFTNDVEGLVITLDIDRFTRLVMGLLTNALRFTERGGIKLELRHDGAKLFLTISDSGPGIAEERLQQLSTPSVGVPGVSNDIGLAFAAAVVAHYQGRFWAESVMGNGSVFYIELPLRHEDAEVC